MAAYTQNMISKAIWPWPERLGPAAAPARGGGIRRRALVQAAVAAAIGLLLALMFKHRIAGGIVLAIAAIVLATGLFLPRAFQSLERAMQALGKGVGAALTWILLVPFFYLCFLPGHLLIALLRKDPLRLRFPSDEPTYWDSRPHRMDAEYFKRQY
jgi:hypothetical protein